MNRPLLPMHRVAALWSKMTGTPRPHRGTLIRWATKGVKGHRLHAERLGGRWYASPDAVADFHRHMTSLPDHHADRAAGPTRTAQIQASLAELDALIAPHAGGALDRDHRGDDGAP